MAARNIYIAMAGLILLASLVSCRIAVCDPCLVVYPEGPCIYYYDPAEYYTVGPGNPFYNAAYDRGGKVLLLVGTNQIDLSIYQAPGLAGFLPTPNGDEGYYFKGTSFKLIIDGFSHSPTTYSNILVVFDKTMPAGCVPAILINGSPLGGNVFHAGDLVVHTPTANGKNYSDVLTLSVSAVGCSGVHVWAFADDNYNGIRDGGECFTAFSHDTTIPIEASSWGRVKAMYR